MKGEVGAKGVTGQKGETGARGPTGAQVNTTHIRMYVHIYINHINF